MPTERPALHLTMQITICNTESTMKEHTLITKSAEERPQIMAESEPYE